MTRALMKPPISRFLDRNWDIVVACRVVLSGLDLEMSVFVKPRS